MSAGVRESPLITSTRPPCRRAHWYTSMVAKPESTASCRMGNSRPDSVVKDSFSKPVSFSHTCRARGVAFEHPIIDRPRLLAPAPRGNLDLDAVLLDIRASRKEQPARRHSADLVRLAPVVELLPLRRFAEQRPRLAQHGVDEDLKQRRVFLRLLELLGGVAPREPTDRTVQAGDVEARRPTVAFRAGAATRRAPAWSASGGCESPGRSARRRKPHSADRPLATAVARTSGSGTRGTSDTAPSTSAGRSPHTPTRSGSCR